MTQNSWKILVTKSMDDAMHNKEPMELVFSSNYPCPQNVWFSTFNYFNNIWDKNLKFLLVFNIIFLKIVITYFYNIQFLEFFKNKN